MKRLLILGLFLLGCAFPAETQAGGVSVNVGGLGVGVNVFGGRVFRPQRVFFQQPVFVQQVPVHRGFRGFAPVPAVQYVPVPVSGFGGYGGGSVGFSYSSGFAPAGGCGAYVSGAW